MDNGPNTDGPKGGQSDPEIREKAAAVAKLTGWKRVFADAVLDGSTAIDALRLARPELGEKPSNRTIASRTWHSRAVQHYVSMASRLQNLEPVGDYEEMRRYLWEEARNTRNPTSRLRAIELLEKLNAVVVPPKQIGAETESVDIIALLRILVGMFPAYGLTLARQRGVPLCNVWPTNFGSFPSRADWLRDAGQHYDQLAAAIEQISPEDLNGQAPRSDPPDADRLWCEANGIPRGAGTAARGADPRSTPSVGPQ